MSYYYKGIRCIKCGHEMTLQEAFDGCPVCRGEESSVNAETYYDFGQDKVELAAGFKNAKGFGLWSHKEFLPIKPDSKMISIGEGHTPLLHAKKLGEHLGLNNLYLKLECMNPTWSYKDRLCSVGVSRAIQDGAPVVTVSSTGNHGASVAAYAAAAGIPCVVFTLSSVPSTMKTLMQSYGAYVFATDKATDRWKIMNWCVKNLGWYPLSGYVSPAMGSNCFGMDGYKTLTFELFEELGDLPDQIVVPSTYSDGLYGMWKGVKDLHEIGLSSKPTKMVAAEVFGSLKATLAAGTDEIQNVHAEDTVSFSIGGGRGTYQGYAALVQSGGYAENCPDDEVMPMQALLGRTEGVYAEAASTCPLVAIQKLAAQGKIKADDTVVAVITSSGLKDPSSTAKRMPEVPVILPESGELSAALSNNYGIKLF